MKKILVVVGTRPNFIKITQFKTAAAFHNFDLRIVHTGQHFDDNLSAIFFQQLALQPDYFLEVSNTDPEKQRDHINTGLTHLIQQIFTPDLIMVVGDVNSTRAAAETASQLNIRIAHVESGLRSFDQTMPEEINRIITDQLSTYFFITEESGLINLRAEKKDPAHLYFVGNTMIDTLMKFSAQIDQDPILEQLRLEENNFALVTLHRPSNVDSKVDLQRSLELLEHISKKMKLVFPIHPRTYQKLVAYDLLSFLQHLENVILTEPLSYFSFQKLISSCSFVITDSGGVQEETTYRSKPCITIRPNTERPSTIVLGTNTLTDWKLESIDDLINSIKNNSYKSGVIPPLWDGNSSSRIFQILAEVL